MFPNARRILKSGVSLDTYKMLLMAASSSRPRHKGLCLSLLRPFIDADSKEVRVHFAASGHRLTSLIRIGELESDWLSVRELGFDHVYRIEPAFTPDLIIDGGGNIGMFTLIASAAFPDAKLLVCEPVPANINQIRSHLRVNDVNAEVLPVCIGGSHRKIPFYVREAIRGSFDADLPYQSIIEVDVLTLSELLSKYPAKRILIKLDIEGMEIEALTSYLPDEQRPVCVIGELHNHPKNGAAFKKLFEDHDWLFYFSEVSEVHSIFNAWSPAAVAGFPPAAMNRHAA